MITQISLILGKFSHNNKWKSVDLLRLYTTRLLPLFKFKFTSVWRHYKRDKLLRNDLSDNFVELCIHHVWTSFHKFYINERIHNIYANCWKETRETRTKLISDKVKINDGVCSCSLQGKDESIGSRLDHNTKNSLFGQWKHNHWLRF